VIDDILNNLLTSVRGASAVIFLDGEGEFISQAGATDQDIRFLGAWKEIHFDQIKEITDRLGLGSVKAVLFSHDQGNELLMPVTTDYCILLFLSAYADIKSAQNELAKAVELLKKDIE